MSEALIKEGDRRSAGKGMFLALTLGFHFILVPSSTLKKSGRFKPQVITRIQKRKGEETWIHGKKFVCW